MCRLRSHKIQICARHFCDENSNFLDAIWSDLSVTTSADKPVPVTSERPVNPSYSLLSSMLSSSCLRHEHAPRHAHGHCQRRKRPDNPSYSLRPPSFLRHEHAPTLTCRPLSLFWAEGGGVGDFPTVPTFNFFVKFLQRFFNGFLIG